MSSADLPDLPDHVADWRALADQGDVLGSMEYWVRTHKCPLTIACLTSGLIRIVVPAAKVKLAGITVPASGSGRTLAAAWAALSALLLSSQMDPPRTGAINPDLVADPDWLHKDMLPEEDG